MTAVVDLALTDTHLWAWSAYTHADIPPSVTPGGDGRLVVGEPLAPPSIAVSVPQLLTADRIAYEPGMPTPQQAMEAVIGHALAELRVGGPCGRLTLVCPTEWDTRRLAVVESAACRYAAQVVFAEAAVRAVLAARRDRDRRTVVVEFGALATTASTVIPTHDGLRVESCEYEPNLAAAEIAADATSPAVFRSLLERLLDGRPSECVLVTGRGDQAFLERIGGIVAEVCGASTELHAVAGADLARDVRQEQPYRSVLPAARPDTEWLQPMRDRAVATPLPRNRFPLYLGVAAVVVLALVIAGGLVLVRGRSDDTDVHAAAPASASPTAPSEPVRQPPTSVPAQSQTFGHIRLTVPAGWHVADPSADTGHRLDLVPDSGPRARITVVQQPVAPDVGYDRVAATLETQIAQRPAGSVTALRRDVVFAGRPGLAYTEHPEDGSLVDWHVIVEHSTQVSIGCQYRTGGQDSITRICVDLATSLEVIP
ncbi:type VII secretion-associated protein [Nocardia brevicatena]|uniref:type VII secretion-associated protein n=1 Tax=Nocardia brevicatena TaxID=37327 RepID=UPI0002E2952A|nr:type VII secretion-associated protein [Nocardia brevicatena]